MFQQRRRTEALESELPLRSELSAGRAGGENTRPEQRQGAVQGLRVPGR